MNSRRDDQAKVSLKVLALETATIDVGAAIIAGGKDQSTAVLATRRVRAGRLQVERLHPLILEVVEESGMDLNELDAIAVDIGPGLFTGLRVGVTTAKALGFGLDLPVIGITATEILHHGARASADNVLSVIDMRRGEVVYARSAQPDAPVLCTPAACIAMIEAEDSLKGALVVGDGVARHLELFLPVVNAKGLQLPGDDQLAPDPVSLAQLALAALRVGSTMAPDALEPLYLRGADAKINWTTRDLSKVQP